MKYLVALVSGMGWHVQDLLRASACLNVRLEVLPFKSLAALIGQSNPQIRANGIELTSTDGILVRMMPPGSLEQVVFRMDVLHRLSAAGIPIVNPPRAIEAAVDKFLATALLDQAGLPVPSTWAGESVDGALEAFENLGRDVVVKPLFGSEGRGLIRVSDPTLARRVCLSLTRAGAVLYLQRFIPHPGFDVRAFVLGQRVIAAMKRHAPLNNWCTNIAQGGQPEPCRLEPHAEDLALRAASTLGACLAGVDLIQEPSGRLLVLEVNAAPGWKALSSVTNIDIASQIVTYLLEAKP